MSTRTQIRFVDPSGNTVAQIYNHSDGYPDSIIPELAELRGTLQNTGWVRGPHYAAAQFIFIRKMSGLRFCAEKLADAVANHEIDAEREHGLHAALSEKDGMGNGKAKAATQMADVLTDPKMWAQMDRGGYFLGGHGVENPSDGIHGDEAYIYEVTVPNGPRDDSGWNVKVSGDFPEPRVELRDGSYRGTELPDGETAWDHAEWDFDGSLADAVYYYIDDEEGVADLIDYMDPQE